MKPFDSAEWNFVTREVKALLTDMEPAEPNNGPASVDAPQSLAEEIVFPLSDAVVRAIFMLLGVGTLLPWNAFVSSKSYFAARLCGSDGKDIVNFEEIFGLVWNSSSMLSLAILIGGQTLSDYWRKNQTNEAVQSPLQPTIEDRPVSDDHGEEETSSRTSHSERSHDHSFFLVVLPFVLYIAVFLLQTVLVLVPHISPRNFLALILCSVGICGTCGTIATAGIVSTAGLFPSHIGINPFFSGQALGGVAVSLANFAAAYMEDPSTYLQQHCGKTNSSLALLFGNNVATSFNVARVDYTTFSEEFTENSHGHSCATYETLDWAVFLYFLAGCVVLLLCLVGFHFIRSYQNQEFRNEYEVVHDHHIFDDSVASNDMDVNGTSPRIGLELKDRKQHNTQELLHGKGTKDLATLASVGGSPISSPNDVWSVPPARILVHEPSSCLAVNRNEGDDEDSCDGVLRSAREGFVEEYTVEVDQVAILSAIKGPATCIFLTFTVTLCLFPSWISELKSRNECKTHARLSNDLYVPFIFCFFNIGDLSGRMLAGRIPVERIRHLSRKLVLGALLRIIFFPLFTICLSTVGSESRFVVQSDFFSLTVQFLFAVTNGLLVSTSFMLSPHLVGHTTEIQERASEIMTFALSFGLLSGSLLTFPFLQIATKMLQ